MTRERVAHTGSTKCHAWVCTKSTLTEIYLATWIATLVFLLDGVKDGMLSFRKSAQNWYSIALSLTHIRHSSRNHDFEVRCNAIRTSSHIKCESQSLGGVHRCLYKNEIVFTK